MRLLLAPSAETHSRLVEDPTWHDPFMLLVAGQSNAVNHGRPRRRAGSGSYAISDEGLFRLKIPCPEPAASAEPPWPHWAALQQRVRPGQEVVLAAIAQGSSAVADWIPVGEHAQRMPDVLKALRTLQLAVDAVVWHQGETEAWSCDDAFAYEANLHLWTA